jgi:protein involved in polysaccharide export with SLBB domain
MKLLIVVPVLISVLLPAAILGQSRRGAVQPLEPAGDTAPGQEEKGRLSKTAWEAEEPLLERAVDPDTYILGPYDILLVSIVGPEQRTFSLAVLPEGDVFLPGVGAVHADGLTLAEFRDALIERVSGVFRNIELYCYLERPRTFRVFVTGAVEMPGSVEASAVERVSDVIERAGGRMNMSSGRMIRLVRDADTLHADVLRFELHGDLERNPFVRSGDRIIVPPGGWRVTVAGPVNRRGMFEVIPGETLEDFLDLIGGFTSEAITDSILVTRIEGAGTSRTIAVTSSDFPEFRLEDKDEVSAYTLESDRMRVFVFGAFQNPGRFYLAEGEGLAELLVRVGGIEDMADLENAALERRGGEIFRLDLREYLPPGPVKHFPLEDGDVIGISLKDNLVRVGGEVQLPGAFPHNNDWTIAKYIGMAGGPSDNGSMTRIELYSSDGTKRSASPDDHPNRGDVIIVKRSRLKVFSEVAFGIIQVGTVVITIIVLTR